MIFQKNTNFIISLLIFLFFPSIFYSQNKVSDEIKIQYYIKNTQINKIDDIIDPYILNYDYLLELSKKYFLSSKDYNVRYVGIYYETLALYEKGDLKPLERKLLYYLNELEEEDRKSPNDHLYSLASNLIMRLFYTEKRLGNIHQGIAYINKYKKNIPQEEFYMCFATAKRQTKEFASSIDYLNKFLIFFLENDKKKTGTKQTKNALVGNIYNNMGDTYIGWYQQEKKRKYLDSAEVNYSKVYDLMRSDKALGKDSESIYLLRKGKIAFLKNNISLALHYYKLCPSFQRFKDNPVSSQGLDLAFADCYSTIKKPDSAIIYLNRFMSKNEKSPSSKEALIYAYHLFSENYASLNNQNAAYKYAKLCLQESETFNSDTQNTSEILHHFEIDKINRNAKDIIEKQKSIQAVLLYAAVFLILVVAIIIFLQFQKKKKIQNQLTELILKVKNDDLSLIPDEKQIKTFYTISNEKEIKIIEKLLELEKKKYFLNKEFSLGIVAKKIGTNTTYLSQAINNYMKKTFSEYSNELRINFILKELSANKKTRNYTTQALAEMVGYKNGSSFARSFKEKTGVTPFQYIETLNKAEKN